MKNSKKSNKINNNEVLEVLKFLVRKIDVQNACFSEDLKWAHTVIAKADKKIKVSTK